jgi:hypothetical protein
MKTGSTQRIDLDEREKNLHERSCCNEKAKYTVGGNQPPWEGSGSMKV